MPPYHRYGTLAMIFEGRQGYGDSMPFCGHDEIVDAYLTVIRETGWVGEKEGFRPQSP